VTIVIKILIAYDYSETADKGIENLSGAGLPGEADVLGVTYRENLKRRVQNKMRK